MLRARSRDWTFAGVVLALSLCVGQPAAAQTAYFDSVTDTIQVAGNTTLGTQLTYEARVCFTAPGEWGTIYDEWQDSQEDKLLSGTTSSVFGFTWLAHGVSHVESNVSLSTSHFYHLAYVMNGTHAALYLDGQKLAERVVTGGVGNAAGSIATVGAMQRDFFAPSFQGYIDTLRLSSVARYAGESFTPPTGDLANDASCVLLYNFNEAAGSTTIEDLSGNGHTGTLGVGFSGATSPVFTSAPHAVPEPGSLGLLASAIWGLLLLRLRSKEATSHD